MERTLDLCRWTYNETLEIRKTAWEDEGKSLSKYETNNLLPEWKENKILRDVHIKKNIYMKTINKFTYNIYTIFWQII